MSKYKVGDKVRVLREKYGHMIPLGSVVEVTEVDKDIPRYKTNTGWHVNDDEIELVESKQEEKPMSNSVGNTIKFPCAVRSKGLSQEQEKALLDKFVELGAREDESFEEHCHWYYYGVNEDGYTQHWDELEDFGDWTTTYSYAQVMAFGKQPEETTATPSNQISVEKIYNVYSDGVLLLSGNKAYLEEFVKVVREALDE